MDELVSEIRKQSKQRLRALFQQEATPDFDPLIELIGMVLADDAGNQSPPADSAVTIQQWQTWNELALTYSNDLTRTINQILRREQVRLPRGSAELRTWAAWLLLSALDQISLE